MSGDALDRLTQPNPQMALLTPLFYAAFALLLVSSLFGSGSVLLLTACHRRLRTSTSVYMVNIALANLLLCLFSVLLFPTSVLLREWPFGDVLCYACPYAQRLAVFVHAYTSAAAAATFARSAPATAKTSQLVSLGVWVSGIALCVPYILFVTKRSLQGHTQCILSWPASVKTVEPLVSFAVLIAFPFVVASLCYVRQIAATRLNGGVAGNARRENVRVFSLMSLLLLVCHVPVYATRAVTMLWTPARFSPFVDLVLLATHAIAVSATCFTAVFFCYICSKNLAYESTRKALAVTRNDI